MTQVTDYLKTHGVPFERIVHQQAYTSVAEARALGIDASEVIKTVAMRWPTWPPRACSPCGSRP